MTQINMTQKVLGRTVFNANTMTYSFEDGSGKIPIEMVYDLELAMSDRNAYWYNGLSYLVTLFAWKYRLIRNKS